MVRAFRTLRGRCADLFTQPIVPAVSAPAVAAARPSPARRARCSPHGRGVARTDPRPRARTASAHHPDRTRPRIGPAWPPHRDGLPRDPSPRPQTWPFWRNFAPSPDVVRGSPGRQRHRKLDVAAVSAGPERGRGGPNSGAGHHGRPAELAMFPPPTPHPHGPRRFAFPEPLPWDCGSPGRGWHLMPDAAAVVAGPERGRGGTNGGTGHHGRPAEIAMLPAPTSHPHRPRRFAFPEPPPWDCGSAQGANIT